MSKNKMSMLNATLGLMVCGSTFAADGLTVNIGADYTSGKYGGTDRTTVWSVPVSAKYTTGPVALRLSVPWLRVSGTGVVIPSGLGGIGDDGGISSGGGGGSVGAFGCAADNRRGARKPEDDGPCATDPTGAAATGSARRTESGFGDIVAAVIYTPINTKGTIVDITGKIKFPTASEKKALGSGKTDYALQAEVEQAIGKGFINGGIGYKWLGDPAGVNLRNVVYGVVGGGYKPIAETTIGVAYDYARAARGGGTAPQEVSLYASQRLNKNVKLNGSIFAGLSDGSPDWGAGVSLGYNF